MPTPLAVLILEDSAVDAELAVRELRRAGFEPDWQRVQTEPEFVAALRPELDLIIADFQLPQFDGALALECLRRSGLDIPFLIVSGALGEERAVELMKRGVDDYLQKDRLTRLGQAVRRALDQRRDRDEKARAERALRDREASYRGLAADMQQQAMLFDTLLSAVPDQLLLLDLDKRVTYANRAVLRYWGKTLKEAVGREIDDDSISEVQRRKFDDEFERARSGQVVRSEASLVAPGGDRVHWDYFLTPVVGDDGKVVAVACASRDITARKEAEELQRRAREMVEQQQNWLEMVLDLLPLPILMAEPGTGRTLFSNKAADKLYGGPIPHDVEAGELAGQFHFADENDRRLPADEVPVVRAARGEPQDGSEAVWHARSGRVHLSFYSETLPASHGHPAAVVVILQDISNLKLIEASLRESIGQLQRERELREIFVSSLSHDLRTPLVAARMSAELLARQQASPSVASKLQGRILDNIDRLDAMIQTLLDANLVRAGERLPLQLAPCRLREIVRDVVDELTTTHGDRYRVVAPTELEGYWDPRFLQRVMENLLTNAVKYGDERAPITITVAAEADRARIHVHNDGEPIKLEDQASLFEPFRRTPAGRGSGKEGWGIGLTLVRGAVEAHGGSVDVDSRAGLGTTFTVTLPLDARPWQNGDATVVDSNSRDPAGG